MLDLFLINFASQKGVNSIVIDILIHKSIYWDKFLNYTSKPLGEVYSC